MNSLYFELIDGDLIFELSSDHDITSPVEQFLAGDGTEIEYALLGYFSGIGLNPSIEIEKVKQSIIRQMKSGANSFTVFL